MPFHGVFHEAYPPAFNGPAKNAARCRWHNRVIVLPESRIHLLEIVAVDFTNGKAERFPFSAQGFQVEHVTGPPESLKTVGIDDHGEVSQPVMGREQRRLPNRAFIAFAVRKKARNANVVAVHMLMGIRHSRGDGKSVAERTGSSRDCRMRSRGRMA